MALKKLSMNVTYVKWADVPVDTTYKGFYMEMKISEKYGNQIHYIEELDGKRLGFNGNANLDRAMEQIQEGWYFELTYKGMTKLETGKFAGADCHQFEIAVDNERVHPMFSDKPVAREEVTYKNSATTPKEPEAAKPVEVKAEAKPAPALAKPESIETRSVF
jgi:hypothetical protein